MSLLGRVIDAGGAHRYELAEVRDGLFIGEGDKPAKLTQFWMLLALSSFIAAGGVIFDSTPAVIGAMIIAPLATPIYGVAQRRPSARSRASRAACCCWAPASPSTSRSGFWSL